MWGERPNKGGNTCCTGWVAKVARTITNRNIGPFQGRAFWLVQSTPLVPPFSNHFGAIHCGFCSKGSNTGSTLIAPLVHPHLTQTPPSPPPPHSPVASSSCPSHSLTTLLSLYNLTTTPFYLNFSPFDFVLFGWCCIRQLLFQSYFSPQAPPYSSLLHPQSTLHDLALCLLQLNLLPFQLHPVSTLLWF